MQFPPEPSPITPQPSYPADRIERTVSTSNQPQHFVATAVWDWPLGKTVLDEQCHERAILGGFKFSGIYQAFSGSPLAITESSCQTNPGAEHGCLRANPEPELHWHQRARMEDGAKALTYHQLQRPPAAYIVPSIGSDD